MAQLDFEIPKDFLKELEKAADLDRIAPKMLEAAAPIVANELKSRLRRHDRTGQLSSSVKASKPKYNEKHGGHSVFVGPSGKSKTYLDNAGKLRIRGDSERNMEKFFIIEYGKRGQAPQPMIADVVKATENAAIEKMREVYEKEAGI